MKSKFGKKMNINEAFPQSIAVTTGTCTDYAYPISNSFATTEVCSPFQFQTRCDKQKEGNNPMNYATATVQAATTETQDQRKYLERRLQEVYSDKREGLEATFGLFDDDCPTSVTDLAERLKEGKYTLRTGDKYQFWHWTDLIQWRDPAKKQDHDGFKAALEELKALKQKSLDIIKIEDPKAGLDAVKALEAWTPTGAAN